MSLPNPVFFGLNIGDCLISDFTADLNKGTALLTFLKKALSLGDFL